MIADEPAHPVKNVADFQYHGLSKRELIAAMALQGILANGTYDPPRRERLKGMSIDAVSAADALLAELAKEPQA